MSDSSQRKLECGLCFLPQGAEGRNNHQGDQIPYRNIWKLVRKNCICIVWLNGLISNCDSIIESQLQRTRPAWPAKTKPRMTLDCSRIAEEIVMMSGIFVEGRRQTFLYSCKR